MKSKTGRRAVWFAHALLALTCLLCVIPLVAVISVSLTQERYLVENGYRLIPYEWNIEAYQYVLSDATIILQAYKITILVSILGTVGGLLVTSLLAYALSRNIFVFRKQLSFLVVFTMLFNGGLVPTYIMMVNYLHLKDSLLALILPYLVGAMNVLILRTFFRQIPEGIIESAKIDGASELTIYARIILPLSKPAIATIGLLILLVYWNDWWLALLYIDNQKMLPLQLLLNRMMSNIEFLRSHIGSVSGVKMSQIPSESARMAMCVVAAGPMLFILPFFQKYFVKGLTIGSVKG
ncbi:carbohydrate ABC transporter permease [Cohnella herbarum]|jgi:putative aldouronate transport system permease protein|uniref:Carbohydrate ABC transporter permease n=1 Tax=Cohnella herbarum TaxID=2728023 RepID=A0A7Z2ZPK7_9BACL|nr:carbohydrate ABC transporter permease [Cohnella herbarum]QJD87488.1 carbohydrate ABC transporter permease [Cohnella herbarum]